MSVKGVIRAIDDVGRITLPKYFRDSLGMETKDIVEITLSNDCIIIKKAVPEEKSNNEN